MTSRLSSALSLGSPTPSTRPHRATRRTGLALAAALAALALTACTSETPPVAAPDRSAGAASAPAGESEAAQSPGADGEASQDPDQSEDDPAASGAAIVGGGAAGAVVDKAAVLTIEDQTSEGPTVNVKAAAVTEGGFVVVAGDGGRNVLGYGVVPAAAEPAPLQVSLAEEPTQRIPLIARLYADTDGDGIFGAADKPVSDGKGTNKGFAGEQVDFSFQGKPVVNG